MGEITTVPKNHANSFCVDALGANAATNSIRDRIGCSWRRVQTIQPSSRDFLFVACLGEQHVIIGIVAAFE